MEKWRAAQNIRPGHEWEKFEGLPQDAGGARGVSCRCAVQSRGPPPPERACDRGAGAACVQAGGRRCRPSRALGWCSTNSRAATASSPRASSPRRPTSRCRPISAPGSTAAGCSPEPRMPTCSGSEKIPSTFNWDFSPKGQHIELGIAEMNLFILLSALGLSHQINGERLLPVGNAVRSLHRARPRCAELRLLPGCALHGGGDALGHHAGARRRRAPVDRNAPDRHGAGRAASFEPAFVDELAVIMGWGFPHMQREGGEGGSVYLRLSTRTHRPAAADHDARAADATSPRAPIGCASPDRTAKS